MEKYKFNPVTVPWKITASDEISLFRCENDKLEVFVIADLFDSAKLDEAGDNLDFFDYFSIVQLRLMFETVLHFGYYSRDSQKYERMIPPILYDRSAFFQKWIDTKSCPDPQMYQVENSDIMSTLNINNNLMTHWNLVSHDETIDIVAKKFIISIISCLINISPPTSITESNLYCENISYISFKLISVTFLL